MTLRIVLDYMYVLLQFLIIALKWADKAINTSYVDDIGLLYTIE